MNKNKKRVKVKNNFFSKNRKGIASEYLPWILISVAVLVILMLAIFLLKNKGLSALDAVKNLLRFR